MAITPETLTAIREAISNPDTVVEGLTLLDQHAAETLELQAAAQQQLEQTQASLQTARSLNMQEYLARATSNPTKQEEDKPKGWGDMTPEEAQAEFRKRVRGEEESK